MGETTRSPPTLCFLCDLGCKTSESFAAPRLMLRSEGRGIGSTRNFDFCSHTLPAQGCQRSFVPSQSSDDLNAKRLFILKKLN